MAPFSYSSRWKPETRLFLVVETALLAVITFFYAWYVLKGISIILFRKPNLFDHIVLALLSMGSIGFFSTWVAFICLLGRKTINNRTSQVVLGTGLLVGIIADIGFMSFLFSEPFVQKFYALSWIEQLVGLLLLLFPLFVIFQSIYWLMFQAQKESNAL